VTTEDKKSTDEWAKTNGVETSYAYDKKGELFRYFGVRGIPDAVLVDASGTIVWRGNPGGLSEKTVSDALGGALPTPFWEWPKEAAKVKKALLADSLQLALLEAEKVGDEYVAIVRGQIQATAEAPGAALAKKDYLRALELSEAAQKALKGLPEVDAVIEVAKTIEADEEALRVLEGQKKLAKLTEKASDLTSRKKIQAVIEDIEELMGKYPGTIVVGQGKEAANALRRKLAG